MTSVRTRMLSLRAPIATEEERELFQRRLALTLLVISALAAAFWFLQLGVIALLAPDRLAQFLGNAGRQAQAATTVLGGAGWLFLRRGSRSVAVLELSDAFWAIGICAGWATMLALGVEPVDGGRRELAAILAATYTLVMRAALVPSPPARTAFLSALGVLPIVPVTWAVLAPVAAERGIDPIAPTIYAAMWGGIVVVAATTISSVIYGLRLQVREAKQLGQYVLDEKIGEGGMGVVYRAKHAMLRRPTAIKLLTGNAAKAAVRFEREVQITAGLTHPNTIAVFDYGRTPDGVFYYAMEYLEGVSLEELVVRHGPQPPSRVVHVLLQMCGALEEAHAAGLVHRDIKPANVMLTERGGMLDVVKMLDFGLVKETAAADPKLSTASTILGTPYYMAPEAILEPRTIDGRADLYALGATAFYLLTGGRVFEGNNLVEICSRHVHQEPDAPSTRRPGIPEALDRVVLACLAKKREGRPKDAATLGDMLRSVGLAEWTRADARAWWAEHGGSPGAAARANASKTRRGAAEATAGATVAVAVDDREAVRKARRRPIS